MLADALLLDRMIALAFEAGETARALRAAGVAATAKPDGSPVTIADQRAEEIIEAGLRAIEPDTPMLGEESAACGRTPALGARFFCVDPIDGTRDFIAGETGEYTVNIALIENGAPILGVIFAPALGELFAGAPGRAFKQRCGEDGALGPTQTIGANAPRGPWRIAISRTGSAPAPTNAFLRRLGDHKVQAISSSLKLGRLAEGAFDLTPRFGEVSLWDIAAGDAILRAAGGGVMNCKGAPIRYAPEETLNVRDFVAYAGEAAKAAALRALR